ncbi:unnamed protein product [Brassica rapa subsp. narinosa]
MDLANDTCLWEPKLLLRVGNRAAGASVASSLDSDLVAFSENPAHSSFAPLAFQPTNHWIYMDSGNLANPFMRVTNYMTRHLATLRDSEFAVRRPGKDPERAVPSPSPSRHETVRSPHVSSSSSPPTVDGFGTGTPEPSPQSQSFSRSYGSILPTSLAYIVPSTRGCSPWRPDAVMSTTRHERHSVLQIFKGRRECTRHHATCSD